MSAWPLANAEFGVVGAAPSQNPAGEHRSPLCPMAVSPSTISGPVMHPWTVWRAAGIHSTAFGRSRLRSVMQLATSGSLLTSEGAVCTVTPIPTRRVVFVAVAALFAVVLLPAASLAALASTDVSAFGATAWIATSGVVILIICLWAARTVAHGRRWPLSVSGAVEVCNVAASPEGLGSGGRLLDHVLDDVDRRNGVVVLRVRAENRRALRLYRSRGFLPSSISTPRGGEVVMERMPQAVGGVKANGLVADVALALLVTVAFVVSSAVSGPPLLGCMAIAASLTCLLAASFVDRRDGRISNSLVLFAAAFAVVAGDTTSHMEVLVLGGIVAAVPLLLIHLLDPSALGFGDVKFAAAGGSLLAAVAWSAATLIPLVALLIAAVRRLNGRDGARPFAPDLLVATSISIVAAATLHATGGLV